MLYRFAIPGKPQAKQRARVTKRGITYTPKETTNYESLIKYTFSAMNPDWVPIPKDVPVRLAVTVIVPIPASAPLKRRELMIAGKIRPTSRPDWDNYGKIVSDSLNELLFKDDSQVVDGSVHKYYGESPGINVEFEVLG
jgi:Holliday junction resolvase RusA-like endonuclease